LEPPPPRSHIPTRSNSPLFRSGSHLPLLAARGRNVLFLAHFWCSSIPYNCSFSWYAGSPFPFPRHSYTDTSLHRLDDRNLPQKASSALVWFSPTLPPRTIGLSTVSRFRTTSRIPPFRRTSFSPGALPGAFPRLVPHVGLDDRSWPLDIAPTCSLPFSILLASVLPISSHLGCSGRLKPLHAFRPSFSAAW